MNGKGEDKRDLELKDVCSLVARIRNHGERYWGKPRSQLGRSPEDQVDEHND
jgi:hypothetical protein